MRRLELEPAAHAGKEVNGMKKTEKKDCGCGCVPPGKTAKAERKPKTVKKQAK